MPSAVKAFYEAIGGDYADAVARFSSEARLIRFLRKFPADDSFHSLSACLQTNDTAGAIFALHSLNGVSALLGFCRLSDTCALLSRALKFGSPDAAAKLFAPPSRGIPHHRFLCFRHAGQGIYLIILT